MIQCNCIATAGACHAGNRGGSNRELPAMAKNGLSVIKREETEGTRIKLLVFLRTAYVQAYFTDPFVK